MVWKHSYHNDWDYIIMPCGCHDSQWTRFYKSHMVWSCHAHTKWSCLMQHTLFGRMLDEMLKPRATNISILDRPHTPTHKFIHPASSRKDTINPIQMSFLVVLQKHSFFSTPVFQNGDYHWNTALAGLRDSKWSILSVVTRGNINEPKHMTDFLATLVYALNAANPISEIIFNFVVHNILMGHLS